LEEGLGFVEEQFGAAGFAEELEGAAGAGDMLFDLERVAGVGGEHQELAVGHLEMEGLGELKAVLIGHRDVAEKQTGGEGAGEGKTIGCRVHSFRFVSVGLEDQFEGVCYKVIVVDDQYTLFHETPRAELLGGNLFVSREREPLIEGLSVSSIPEC
jgi:hypothetical protein